MQRHVLSVLLLALACCLPLSATTYTVTNTSASGAGSLSAAIASANGDNTATSASPHLIIFTVTGTITPSADLSITNFVRIIGPGAPSLRVRRSFLVGNSTTASITGITIANASVGDGGALQATPNTTVTLTNCHLVSNSASDGGALYNNGTMTIVGCTIDSNTTNISGQGGGIFNSGTLTMTNCTVANNIALLSATGGGIYNSGGTLTMTNCTVAGNTASNGGGLARLGGTVSLTNCIVAGNSASFGPDVSGTVSSQGHNLIGKTDGSSGWVASDLTGTTASPLNAMLGGEQDNGGKTPTMALLTGSPAIDAGDDAVVGPPKSLTSDQRGDTYVRLSGSHVDIGAFEVQVTDTRLPIELSGFSLAAEGQLVYLRWNTASEVDNAGFEVQRAGSDSQFVAVGSYLNDLSLAGLGTSSSGRTYSYVDGGNGALVSGTTYLYRLVDVATDGRRTEHAPLSVTLDAVQASTLAALRLFPATPNPAKESLALRYSLPEPRLVTVELFGVDGSRVASGLEPGERGAGEHSESISLTGLPAGSYTLVLTAGREQRSERFVVVR